MTNRQIGLATSSEFPSLSADDRLVLESLRDHGIDSQPVVWSDGSVEWQEYDVVIIRSCWDYHRRVGEFRSWISLLEEADITLWNPPAAIRWNLDKSYQLALAAAGVPTIPTAVIDQSSPRRLETVLRDEDGSEAVLKPSIAATAYHTSRVSLETAATDQTKLKQVLTHSDALVQPFVPEIQTKGEWSLVFLDGEFSHSVKKYAQQGDYRVQSEFGGSVTDETAPQSLVDLGRRVLDAVDYETLYARADGVETTHGFRLMELELVDPELFFRHSPAAVERFIKFLVASS